MRNDIDRTHENSDVNKEVSCRNHLASFAQNTWPFGCDMQCQINIQAQTSFKIFYTNLNMRRNHFYPSIKFQQSPRCEEYPRVTLIRNNNPSQEVRTKVASYENHKQVILVKLTLLVVR